MSARALFESEVTFGSGQLHGHCLIWDEGVVSCFKHATRVSCHQWRSLNMEATKHLIRSPLNDETNNIRVNLCEEQSVGSSSTKTSGRDVFGKKAKFRTKKCDTFTESFGNETWGNLECFVVEKALGQWRVCRCIVGAKVDDPAR